MLRFAFGPLQLFSSHRSDPIFEWDPRKNQRNIQNHRIDFDTAATVFNDPNRTEYLDLAHADIEERYITFGRPRQCQRTFMVVYTIRKNNVIRLISARYATRREEENYYDHSQTN